MKKILQILLLCFVTNLAAQNKNYEKWISIAQEDPSLQPEYGNIEKTPKQLNSDKEFVDKLLAEYKGDKIGASNKMMELGFQYLYEKSDFITSMRRFNQAFLLNPKNANIYYGYGSIYFNLGALEEARKQYDKGLRIEPNNFEILTDYGTTYLGDYYDKANSEPTKANENLNLGLEKLIQSYNINPNYPSTPYKLSIIYLYKNDCENSKKFLNLTKEIDSEIITQDYLNEFNSICRNDNLDCSDLKTGKFKIKDESSGITLITRTEKFQIEENENLGYKLKLSITWTDDCTYILKPVEDLLNPENKNLPTMIVTCFITAVNKDNYMQTSTSDIDSFKMSTAVEILR